MSLSYNKLWKLMIDRGYNKTKLCTEAKISTNAMAKMGKNQEVRLDVLARICSVLDCKLDDIVEVMPNEVVVGGGNNNG